MPEQGCQQPRPLHAASVSLSAEPSPACSYDTPCHPLFPGQVPLVWAATLAYHGQFFLKEAGLVGQVSRGHWAGWLGR